MANGGTPRRKIAGVPCRERQRVAPGAAISAWTAYLRNKTAGKELSEGEEAKYAPPVRVAQDRGLGAWKEFDVFRSAAQAHTNETFCRRAADFDLESY